MIQNLSFRLVNVITLIFGFVISSSVVYGGTELGELSEDGRVRLAELKQEAGMVVVMEGGKFYSRYSEEGKEVVRRLDSIQSLANPYPTPIPINIPGAPYDHMDPLDLFLPPMSTPPPTPVMTPYPTPEMTPYPTPTPYPVYPIPFSDCTPTPTPTPYPTPIEEYCVLNIPIISPPPPVPVITPYPTPEITPYPMATPFPTYPIPVDMGENYDEWGNWIGFDGNVEEGGSSSSPITIIEN